MRILVIGSEGFIGSNASAFFRKRGHEVLMSDIIKKEEINYYYIDPDHCNFQSVFSETRFDVCINASGTANVQFSFANTTSDFIQNVVNVFYILETIKQYNPQCKFINFSSAAVYGNPDTLPVREDAKLHPLSPYGYHKLFSEGICKEFFEVYNIPTLSVRVFSAFGPGMRKQLFWDLYQKSLAGDHIELFGTGKETRDFVYIEDVICAIELLIDHHYFNGGVVNIGNGEGVAICDAASLFLKLIGWKGKLSFTKKIKIGDPLFWKSDSSIIKKLGYKKSYSLEEGLSEYIQWLKRN